MHGGGVMPHGGGPRRVGGVSSTLLESLDLMLTYSTRVLECKAVECIVEAEWYVRLSLDAVNLIAEYCQPIPQGPGGGHRHPGMVCSTLFDRWVVPPNANLFYRE
jgi:hypothetical protein